MSDDNSARTRIVELHGDAVEAFREGEGIYIKFQRVLDRISYKPRWFFILLAPTTNDPGSVSVVISIRHITRDSDGGPHPVTIESRVRIRIDASEREIISDL